MNFKLIYATLLSLSFVFLACEREKTISIDFPTTDKLVSIYALICNPSQYSGIEYYKTKEVLEQNSEDPFFSVSGEFIADVEKIQIEFHEKNKGIITSPTNTELSYKLSLSLDEHNYNTETLNFPDKVNIDSFHKENQDEFHGILDLYVSSEYIGTKYVRIKQIYYSEGKIIESDFGTIEKYDQFQNRFIIKEKFQIWTLNTMPLEKLFFDKIKIELYSMSEHPFNFYESFLTTEGLGNQNSIDQETYSNIDNAFGYFGTATVDTITIKL